MDDLLFSYADPADPPARRAVIRLIERCTGQPRLRRIYGDYRAEGSPGSFFGEAVRRLGLTLAVGGEGIGAIPREGPVVVVANHPYGVLDGIVLAALVEQARRDFLVMTNAVLLRAPEARPFLLPVDFSGTAAAQAVNVETRSAARRHLERGGCLVLFPAGAVSTSPDRLGRRPAEDAEWQPFLGQLVQRAQATTVPVFFAGQNSRLFQIASHVHPALRLSLIFKEVRDRMNTTLAVAIGAPVPFGEVAHLDRRSLASELRRRTHALAPVVAAPTDRRVRVRPPASVGEAMPAGAAGADGWPGGE